jgi:pyrroline-5-carboxylate reductase
MKLSSSERIAFIGGGNMAEALIRGLCESGASPRAIAVSEPIGKRRALLAKRYRVQVHASSEEALARATLVVLAVKPQTMAAALTEIRRGVGRRHLVVSIAAGVPLAVLEKGLGTGSRVVRVMPNTPCLIGEGMSMLVAGKRASPRDVARARALFETVGLVEIAESESWMDAVTGLSGSGPAYVYRFAEALIEGGVRVGLPRPVAERLAFQTLRGASGMLLATNKSPSELREAVSSPGGTTLAGLARMQEGKFFETVRDGVRAATLRSRELARAARRSQ